VTGTYTPTRQPHPVYQVPRSNPWSTAPRLLLLLLLLLLQ
jgi:hypothetical protein